MAISYAQTKKTMIIFDSISKWVLLCLSIILINEKTIISYCWCKGVQVPCVKGSWQMTIQFKH